jgi:serine O-acetyltransferase
MVESRDEIGAVAVSAEVADWSREQPRQFWDPSRKLLLAIRRYQHWRNKNGIVAACACKWFVLRHHFWSIVTGARIPLNCKIEGGLLINHPNGIVINPEAAIGVNCLIFHEVTITSDDNGRGVPEIAGHVDIGAGAKVLGPIKIGAHAKIGAISLVITDVPAGATALGVPARILPGTVRGKVETPNSSVSYHEGKKTQNLV